MDWTEKYRPRTLDAVLGNPTAVNTLRAWARSWESGIPQMRAVVLMGSPGVGKTTSAEALAREMGWGIVEMNASDQRRGADIEQVAILGSRFNTFADDGSYLDSTAGMRKLIVLDEADSFFGNADRGAMPVVNELIRTTRQPVILIVNDFYAISRKSSTVKNETLQITFKKPQASTISKALTAIAKAEGVEVDPEAMRIIAENAGGDMRAAVRNLESLALGMDRVTVGMAEELSARADRRDMYDLMTAIFRRDDPAAARTVLSRTDEDPETVGLWVDENLPFEFPDRGDLVRGYEKLSRADIFMGRVHRRQYYRFWSYAGDMMTFGVATSRMTDRRSHERMRFPNYLTKMSRSKSVRALRSSVVMKLAVHLHTSTRRVELDVLPQVKVLVANDADLRLELTDRLGLEPDELAFLLNAKADSKKVKDVFKVIDGRAEERRLESNRPRPRPQASGPLDAVAVPAPVAEAPVVAEPVPVAKAPAPKTASKPSAQRSLFDF